VKAKLARHTDGQIQLRTSSRATLSPTATQALGIPILQRIYIWASAPLPDEFADEEFAALYPPAPGARPLTTYMI
jgi:hypothetical protein